MPTFGTAADDEVVSLHEQFYIQATSSRADDRTRVLKHDETFAVFDRFGDVQPVGLGEQGIYHDGTRFLSRLELRLGGRRPLLLSSTVKKENDLLTVDLATPDLKDATGQLVLPRGTLHVFRTKFAQVLDSLFGVRVPATGKGTATAYLKHPHPASGYAVVGVAVVLQMSGGKCQKAAIGVNGVAGKAYRASAVEKALVGKALDEKTVADAAAHAADGADVQADLYASSEFRAHLASVYTKRAILKAASRAT